MEPDFRTQIVIEILTTERKRMLGIAEALRLTAQTPAAQELSSGARRLAQALALLRGDEVNPKPPEGENVIVLDPDKGPDKTDGKADAKGKDNA